jgi:hypothetical protein
MPKNTDLVINEWEKAIGPSPHKGFEEFRNLDTVSNPGAVSLEFEMSAMTLPPTVSTLAYTTDTTANTVTVASTSGWFNGMAITLDTVVTSTGISTGRVYWVGDLTATTFKLYKNPSLHSGQVVDITGSNGSGTLTSYTLGAPLDKAMYFDGTGSTIRNYLFILDENGRAWWIKNSGGTLTTSLVYLGNDTLTSTNNRAITVWKSHLIVFRSGNIDALPVDEIEASTDFDTSSGWTYGLESISSVSGMTRRAVYIGNDDVMYFQNGSDRLGSLTEVTGSTFDPTSSATWTEAITALDLPAGDDVTAIGEIGDNLLVGTRTGKIYPWNKVLSSYSLPVALPENYIERIIMVNNLAYVFAGYTGNIYVSDGVSYTPFYQIPQHIFGVDRPYITWKDTLGWQNQLYISFTATDNSGATISSVGGVWAINIGTKAFRHSHLLSPLSYAANATVLLPNTLTTSPAGDGLYIGWSNGSTYGVDTSASTYYTDYAGYCISMLYTVGLSHQKRTYSQLDVIFEKELAAGEGVKVSFRRNRTDSFADTQTIDYATYGAISSLNLTIPADDIVTFQVKLELTGDTTTPIVKELRFR